MKHWTFLTSHGLVLICIAQNPDARVRDIAGSVGITERATQRIISDLEKAGYVAHTKIGRRNSYTVNKSMPLRHRLNARHKIGELIDVLANETAPDGADQQGS